MQKTVLVTGAGGFIGKYVVDKLCKMGYAVTALVHNHIPQYHDSVKVIKADICDEAMPEQIAAEMGECGACIHLAADIDMRGSGQTILTNCLGTYHLASLANMLSAEKFIYMSSLPVIGVPRYLPVTEQHPAEPVTLYHITKYTGEKIVNKICSPQMQKIILRISSPIGIGMNQSSYLSILLNKCCKNESIEVFGQGKRCQNYIDVRDIARAAAYSLKAGQSGLYLIAGKNSISNLELAYLCKKITDSDSDISYGIRDDSEENFRWIISGKKAEIELGFLPEYGLEESLRWIYSSFLKKE